MHISKSDGQGLFKTMMMTMIRSSLFSIKRQRRRKVSLERFLLSLAQSPNQNHQNPHSKKYKQIRERIEGRAPKAVNRDLLKGLHCRHLPHAKGKVEMLSLQSPSS